MLYSVHIQAALAITHMKLSQEEEASVAYMFKKLSCIVSLTNDYYSFYNEFDQRFAAKDYHKLTNAIGLLMRDYGYTEDEAFKILKNEIRKLEVEVIEDYKAWEISDIPKSSKLREYVCLFFLSCGGMNHWMSFCPRYHNGKSAKDSKWRSTKEDRTELLGNCSHAVWKLSDSPHDHVNGRNDRNRDVANGEVSNTNNSKSYVNGGGTKDDNMSGGNKKNEDIQLKDPNTSHTSNGNHPSKTGWEIDRFFQPYQRDLARGTCAAPMEYMRCLPTKHTFGKLVDALNIWYKLPQDATERVKSIFEILVNSGLM